MDLNNLPFWFLLSIEATALCLLVVVLLLFVIRRLKKAQKKSADRIQGLKAQLKAANAMLATEATLSSTKTYTDWLTDQVEATRDFHHSLAKGREIALDLDPETPERLRTAATRHALLIAEMEATASSEGVRWELLAARYQQLINFNRDFAPANKNHNELKETKNQLEQATRRIENLEGFQQMYFDLKQQWHQCRGMASEQYQMIRDMAQQRDDGELASMMAHYHDLYQGFAKQFEAVEVQPIEVTPHEHSPMPGELQKLREFAAHQHSIIAKLSARLQQVGTTEVQAEVLDALQAQLNQQTRFLNESETCIQLLEDELEYANKKIADFKVQAFQSAKRETKGDQADGNTQEKDKQIHSLTKEIQNLRRQLKVTHQTGNGERDVLAKTRKEYSDLREKYDELEEKFLKLKLKE